MKKELGIGVLLVVLCIVVSIMSPVFLHADNLQTMMSLVGIYGIFGMGLGVVIITGGIDLSVGSVFALQGIIFCMMVHGQLGHPDGGGWMWPWPLALVGSLFCVMLLGVFHGFLVTKVKLQPFIVTLCGLLIYRSLARFIADDQSRGRGVTDYGVLEKMSAGSYIKIPGFHIGSFHMGALEIPNQFLLLLVISAVMYVVLHRSVYGRYLFAVGRNEEAARYSGLNTKLIIGSAYVLCMLLTGISGVLLVFYLPSVQASSFGNSYELYGIAAAVLGGCSLRGGEGSILGIFLGTALLQVLQNLVNILNIPTSLNGGVMGVVILIGVATDQLLAERKRRNASKLTLATPVATQAPKS